MTKPLVATPNCRCTRATCPSTCVAHSPMLVAASRRLSKGRRRYFSKLVRTWVKSSRGWEDGQERANHRSAIGKRGETCKFGATRGASLQPANTRNRKWSADSNELSVTLRQRQAPLFERMATDAHGGSVGEVMVALSLLGLNRDAGNTSHDTAKSAPCWFYISMGKMPDIDPRWRRRKE